MCGWGTAWRWCETREWGGLMDAVLTFYAGLIAVPLASCWRSAPSRLPLIRSARWVNRVLAWRADITVISSPRCSCR